MLTFTGELTYGHQCETFAIPAGMLRLTLTGTTVNPGFLYAYLYDARQKLRASILLQKPEKTVVIGLDHASLGGVAGEIPAGHWALHLYNLDGEDRSHSPFQYRVAITADDTPLVKDDAALIRLPLVPNLNAGHDIIFDYSAMKNPASGWYRGDMHAHTILSDGHNTLEAAVEIIESQQLDFIFLTEHNICHPALPDCQRTLVLPGIEVTTDKGHFNVHGPQRGLVMRDADCSSAALISQGLEIAGGAECTADSVPAAGGAFAGGTLWSTSAKLTANAKPAASADKTVNRLSARRGNISINHPMMKPWHWHYADMPLSRVDTMEICCDPTWSTSPASTDAALDVLSEVWNQGHKIYAVGGSDSHLQPQERNPSATEPSLYGDPATFVFSHGLSGEGILAGLRQGQVYIERRCGLTFTINQGKSLPGQDVGNSQVAIQVAVTDRSAPYYAECIGDGEVIARQQLQPVGASFTVNMQRYRWARIDIRRGDLSLLGAGERGEFEAVINPVFNGQHPSFAQPQVQTWGELIEAMENHGR